MRIELTEPQTDHEFEQYYHLRYQRLREQHGLPAGSERDHPAESSSSHLVAKADGRVVGAACWALGLRRDDLAEPRVYARFRQLAVDPEFEGRGVGIVMTRYIEKRARELGAREVVGNVRLERVPYFEHLGYVVIGKGETLFDSVEHMSMVKPLS